MSRLISDTYEAWKAECNARFAQLKSNEEELNRIFIEIYGLQDELSPTVEERDVTVHFIADSKEDAPEGLQKSPYLRTKRDEIVSLISYAVGCMFGRYSLDVEGLAFAGGAFRDQWAVVRNQSAVSSGKSAVGSGRYYKREVIEFYVSEELSRVDGMAKIYGFGRDDLQSCEMSPQNGNLCPVGSDPQGGRVDPFQYRRGTAKKLYEGICELSVNGKRVECGGGNPAYDLCSPEILDAIASGTGAELVRRGWQDAERIDWASVHCSLTTGHYSPDADNIIPICDDDYFEDDITGKLIQWVAAVYGEDTLAENLAFIADALGGKGTPREVIRGYFLNDFYADHLRTYQKRPIYWLFDSGKKNGFKALIYLHRYQPDLLARMRTDYVHEQQERYRTQIRLLEDAVPSAAPAERIRLNKRIEKLRAQSLEIQSYEEKIHHLADRMIHIDLDDGVKQNYAIFQDVLAKIK